MATTCSVCGTQNSDGRRFCDQCGAGLSAGCPACGEPNRTGARFCGACGSPLPGTGSLPGDSVLPDASARTGAPGAPGTSGTPVAPATPVRPAAPGASAERRLVSVLFADLVGFTPFAEERDPEQVRELLTRYFEAARAVIERHGGSVEKFIGDAVMAAWGTPVAYEDDAERAVRAGLEVIDAVRGLEEGLEARVGVLTGEAAVTLGAQGQGMLAGDLVNTAARLQSVALPGTLLVGEATMRAASAAVAFEPVADQALKGKGAPVPTWRALRVVGERRGRSRVEGIEPPFVGRELELRLLKDLLHATGSERRSRLVSITGPAGIGKSRLAWEFEKYLDGVVESVFWHRGRSPSYGEGITFWALGEMVRRRADLREDDDERTTRAGISRCVVEYVPDPADQAWVEPALLTLLGLEPAPAGGRDLLFAAWRIFFERIAAQGTTVLLFEDLQWADGGLLDFIDHVLEWSRGVPLLVITLARPELLERRPGWGTSARSSNAIGLEPLTADQMRELLAGLVPDLPRAASERILARADGMPLYAVETVRMLVGDGRLEPMGDGRFRPTGDLGELAVPDTLRALVASRLDALDPEDRDLLQDAAVLGRSFTPAALAAITGRSAHELEGRLRTLMRRELLEITVDPRAPERGQYAFVQSVIREVAYGTLSRRERKERHIAAARHYEGLGDDELAGALAAHYLAAHESSEAGPEADALAVQARLALRGAADRAMSLGSPDQAVALLLQALTTTSLPAERGDLLERAATAADHLARYEDAERFVRDAMAAFGEAGDGIGVGRTAALAGGILADASRLVEAEAVLAAALATLEGSDQDEVRAAVLARLSRVLMRLGRDGEAVSRADEALAIAEPRALERIIAEAFVNKGTSLSQLGRWRESVALISAGIELASATGDVALELRARNNLGSSLSGDSANRLVEVISEAYELAQRVGVRQMVLWLAGTMAMAHIGAGRDWDRAAALLEEGLAMDTEPADRGRLLAIRMSLRLLRGEEIEDLISECEALARETSDPDAMPTILLIRASLALFEGDSGRAWDLCGEALGQAVQSANDLRAARMRIALWSADPGRAREALSELETETISGSFIDGQRAWARAGSAALDGRREEAISGMRQALRIHESNGFRLEAALERLDACLLLPDAPDAATWAADARAFFESVGALPYLRKLDQAVSSRVG